MKTLFTVLLFSFLTVLSLSLTASDKKTDDLILRDVKNIYDLQVNTVSPIEFFTTNYGEFGLDVAGHKGGLYWPRGSQNQYFFASGIWFGARKKIPDSNVMSKLVSISYNPNNGRSWFVPGQIDNHDTVDRSKLYMYRVYFSTDMDEATGQPKNSLDGPAWPLWYNNNTFNSPLFLKISNYEPDSTKRSSVFHPGGPLFFSDEDIFCSYKDSDLSRYDDGAATRAKQGYPLRLQFDQIILTWNKSHPLQDCAILTYLITNKSKDTLIDCSFGGVYDLDITKSGNPQNGAVNDRFRFYEKNPQLRFAYAWTDTNQGEAGQGFGYAAIALIETPSVDENNYIRKDKNFYLPAEQVPVSSFKIWQIFYDMAADNERYDALTSGTIDVNDESGDNRILLSTDVFNLRPGETARFSVLITFSLPCKATEADGTYEDIECDGGLVDKIQKVYKYYYSIPTGTPNKNGDVQVIKISPNPATDYVQIAINNHEIPGSVVGNNYKLKESGSEIRIYNVLGKCVLTYSLPASLQNGVENKVKIDVSGLSPGIYFIRINGMMLKFVKI